MTFFDFLNISVTPYHAANAIVERLISSGFSELSETELWTMNAGGSYFICRGSSVFAFRVPKKFSADSRFRLASAHTDFPSLRITPNPDKTASGIHLLHPEVYGGALLNTWLDRDLGFAGLLVFERDERVSTKLFRSETLCRIPELAIHLNRNVNSDGLKLNSEDHLNAFFSALGSPDFSDVLKLKLSENEKLLDFDAQFFDAQSAATGGLNDEWIFSGRLDNLSSCDALIESLRACEIPESDICGVCFFNSEEIGSKTRDGAGGNFLIASLNRIFSTLGGESILFSGVLSDSILYSLDMAHAEHPSFSEKSEQNHAPILGKGVVLKVNAQNRYAMDPIARAHLKRLCKLSNVPLQTFVMRNDMPSGSTVGPELSTSLGIHAVDIGEPMLSMHSIRELTAVADHISMKKLMTNFFER